MTQYPIFIGLFVALVMVCFMPNPVWWMIAVLGIGANGLVVAANGWKMPVRGLLEEAIRHTPMSASTRHKWLADIIPTGLGKASVGDFFICAGILGAYATRDSLTYVNLMAVLCLAWWGSGWVKGFALFEKWPKEARRDARKNIPIMLFLMLVGNLLSIRGCSVGELRASVAHVETMVASAPKVTLKPKSEWRDLGTIISPSAINLRRLRAATDKQEREDREAVIKAVASLDNPSQFSFVTTKSARRGPFCRVTCAAHHGGQYDVETVPELCRANWIPPTAFVVPGWIAMSEKEETTNPWPGPAQPGFENYKLYWSGIQSDAKVIHASLQTKVQP